MTAPDRIIKGNTDITGREGIRFYKNLSNGYVLVVEREYKNSPNDMETITMWAEKSSAATNARSQKNAPDTLVRNAIRSTDIAKIQKDAEAAISGEEKLLYDKDGIIYGATIGGKIYLNGSALNPETPIHEYTHLWDTACQNINPELWLRGVELMKQTPLWEQVQADPAYADLTTDDEIAGEVHSRLTGKDGARLLEDIVSRNRDGNAIEVAKAVTLRERLKKWLKDFWWWLKDTLSPWTRAEAERVTIEDFVYMPLKDLVRGTDLKDGRMDKVEESRIGKVNSQFNEELQQQIDGTLPKGHVYRLGMPSAVLLASGIPGLPIEMAASRMSNKSMQENHPFDLSEIKNLPRAIHVPMAVFRSATHIGSYVVMTEIEHNEKNFVVAIETNRKQGRIYVNGIRSVYPKNNGQVANWIEDGLLEYADKERMAEWFSKQRSNSAEVRKLFNHTAKIVKNFENPKVGKDNFRQDAGDIPRYHIEKERDEEAGRNPISTLQSPAGSYTPGLSSTGTDHVLGTGLDPGELDTLLYGPVSPGAFPPPGSE